MSQPEREEMNVKDVDGVIVMLCGSMVVMFIFFQFVSCEKERLRTSVQEKCLQKNSIEHCAGIK